MPMRYSELVGVTPPLGKHIEYNLASAERANFVRENCPRGINERELNRVFKKDIYVDSIVERLNDAIIYFIYNNEGRGDELYYFECNGKLFHGEKIWSTYHPFLNELKYIQASERITEPCWFVGSRNNYTHQLIDFIPNLIHRYDPESYTPNQKCANIFGKQNQILDSLKEIPLIKEGLSGNNIYLHDHGDAINIGKWNIKCIEFSNLYLVKHLSIFKAFDHVRTAMKSLKKTSSELGSTEANTTNSIVYLSRNDNRVENQEEIEQHLITNWNATIMKDLHKKSYTQKRDLLKEFEHVILPPGSDNINAFCFSNKKTRLMQLVASQTSSLLENPFNSFAGLRYMLPFLHRNVLINSDMPNRMNGLYSGTWSLETLDQALKSSEQAN